MAVGVEDAVRRVPENLGPVWYRGWVIPAAHYADLHTALAARDTLLCTTPPAYRSAHELPGWYGSFADATPPSTWLTCQVSDLPDGTDPADLLGPLLTR